MENISNGGYQGHLYPINPRSDVILGRPCYRSVKDIPGPVDIAIFCIPARFVAQVLEECGEKGIRGAVLIPSGFAEVGEAQLQQRSEEHTSELQSLRHLVCRLLLEKNNAEPP